MRMVMVTVKQGESRERQSDSSEGPFLSSPHIHHSFGSSYRSSPTAEWSEDDERNVERKIGSAGGY